VPLWFAFVADGSRFAGSVAVVEALSRSGFEVGFVDVDGDRGFCPAVVDSTSDIERPPWRRGCGGSAHLVRPDDHTGGDGSPPLESPDMTGRTPRLRKRSSLEGSQHDDRPRP
jgi:hypothetical protein